MMSALGTSGTSLGQESEAMLVPCETVDSLRSQFADKRLRDFTVATRVEQIEIGALMDLADSRSSYEPGTGQPVPREKLSLQQRFGADSSELECSEFREFRETNFLKVYDAARDYKSGSDSVRLQLLHGAFKLCKVPLKSVTRTKQGRVLRDPDEQALYAWTTDLIYKRLNLSVLLDEPRDLSDFGYVIRAINRYIVSHPAPKGPEADGSTKL